MKEKIYNLLNDKSEDIVFESQRINYVRISDKFIEDYLKMVNNPKINKFIS